MQQVPSLGNLKGRISKIREALQTKFDHPQKEIILDHRQLNKDIFNFQTKTGPNKTTDAQRIDLLLHVNYNLHLFLNKYIKPKLKQVSINNPHSMVQLITRHWSNYQKLIYCYDFILNRMKTYCNNFHKVQMQYKQKTNGQILGPVAVMAVKQLKKFIQVDFKQLIKIFADTFCSFIAEERKNINVPKQYIKSSLIFFQSCYFNHQATIERQNDKIFLTRRFNSEIPAGLRASENIFFTKNILPAIIESVNYYQNFVKNQAPNIPPSDELQMIKKFYKEEVVRAHEYIHYQQSKQEYFKKLNQILILQSLPERIKRPQGLRKFLRAYDLDNPQGTTQMEENLKNFWEIYSKQLSTAIGPIIEIYTDYLIDEAKTSKSKVEKPKDFIQAILKINKKNNKILEIFGKNFALKNLFNNSLSKILSSSLLEEKTQKGLNFRGARNLAFYTDLRFRQIYHKPNQQQTQVEIVKDLTDIFKILIQKDTFLKQHQKFTANRLIEQIDFGKDQEFASITKLENSFLNEIRNELGFSQVKELNEKLKDMARSQEDTKKVKAQLTKKFGNKYHQFNQIIIKNSAFWSESVSFQIDIPPNALVHHMHVIRQAIGNKKGQIKFELNNGVSLFKGVFQNAPQQNFLFKNIYLVILLFIDQESTKKITFGDLKRKIKTQSGQSKKGGYNNQLERNMIQLLWVGLLKSNKQLKEGKSDVAKVQVSDVFQINRQFNFQVQQKRQRRPPQAIKKLRIIPGQEITRLPQWLVKSLRQDLNQQKMEYQWYQELGKARLKNQVKKLLKHSHNLNKNCNFDDFMKGTQKIRRQYAFDRRTVKQSVQLLINQGDCQRVEQQKNTYRYIA